MKFMHIFPDSIFLNPFLVLLSEHLPEQFAASYFFVTGRRHPPTVKCDRLIVVESRIGTLKKYLELLHFDRIIWHSFDFRSRMLLFLSLCPGVLRRSIWVIWGFDLYNRSDTLQADQSFRERVRFRLFRHVAPQFGGVATLIPGDYEYARSVFSIRGRRLTAIYPDVTPVPHLRMAKTSSQHEPLRMLVGNSASRTNLHEDILRRLSTYKDHDIEVVVPLSYGDARYAEEVCRLGESLLGPKFKPLLNWMSPEDYAALLDSVDLGIFNQLRQQALGNISYLIQAGKHVFVRRDGPMWAFFVNDLGIDVSDACVIGSVPFKELHAPVDGFRNHARMNAFIGTENMVRAWQEILA